jgi:hypothetical protein
MASIAEGHIQGQATRSFMEVPLQDIARTPLPEGRLSPGMCVFGTLAVARNKTDGGQIWRNFVSGMRRSGTQDPEGYLVEKGVHVYNAALIGWNENRTRRVVVPEEVPRLLASVLPKTEALNALKVDLLNTLIARGLAEEVARDAIEDQKTLLDESPQDLQLVKQVLTVFGVEGDTETHRLRRKRVPHRGGSPDRTTMVFSANDLVMLAKGCSYNTARQIVDRILKEYYEVNLESFEINPVEEVVDLSVGRENIYKVQFPCQGQRKTLALTVEGCSRLLQIFPRTLRRVQYKSKDHLYVMQYSFDSATVKIGRSFDVEARRRGMEACHNFRVKVVRVYRYHGHLEKILHRHLKKKRSILGAGKEWFSLSSDEAVRFISSFILQQNHWVQGLKRRLSSMKKSVRYGKKNV